LTQSATFSTNAEMIAGRLARKCVGGSRIIDATGKRIGKAEIYPEDVCKETIRGLRDQMQLDGRLSNTGVGCVFAVEEGESEMVFYDDVTGEVLDWEGVINARAEEIKEFRKHTIEAGCERNKKGQKGRPVRGNTAAGGEQKCYSRLLSQRGWDSMWIGKEE
jgi:hypothetical protein